MEETLRPPTRTLAAAQFANSLGDGTFYVTSALFFTQVVGLSAAQVGSGLTCAWTVGLLASALIGSASDRFGLRLSAVSLAVGTAGAIGMLAVIRSFPAFVLATVFYAVCQSGLGAVRQALLVGFVPARERLVVRARLQARVNAGLALGAAVGGVALLVGSDTAYLAVLAADGVAFLVAAGLLQQLPKTAGTPVGGGAATGGVLAVLADRRFVAATFFNAVLYLYMPVLSVLVPLWVADRTAAPLWVVGALFVLNTTGVVLLQQVAARQVRDLDAAARSIARGSCLLGLACILLWASAQPAGAAASVAMLVLAGAVLVAGEMLVAAGSWEVGFALADPNRPGQWQGFYSSGIPAARAVGPSLLVALVLTWTGPGWLVLAAIFSAAGLAMRTVVRGAEPLRPGASARPVHDDPAGADPHMKGAR